MKCLGILLFGGWDRFQIGAMENTEKIDGLGNVHQLKLVADEVEAFQISNNLLVGKVISGKVVAKNVVQMTIRRV